MAKKSPPSKPRYDSTERDIAMLNDPDNWPLWPRLPLKNTKDGQLGVCYTMRSLAVEGNTEGFRVYLCNMFDDITKTTVFLDYPNEYSLLISGWRVD